jgi:arabinogalactan endo-1,4-beta-galactosidase
MKDLTKILLFASLPVVAACVNNKNDSQTALSGFAKGADVGWVTEMEAAGKKFYAADGKETDCFALMKELGMNAIRLRVWVNPENVAEAKGWCSATDVLAKAKRAHALGLRLMIDFHYSDWWADPGKQNIPAAWVNMNLEEMKTAVAAHTIEVLNLLKINNIEPEWVQVGNETTNGMLWTMGQADKSMANYAALHNAGYDAAKAAFPNAKVIVHIDNGFDNARFRWILGGLKQHGGKWDVIGMSLYPSATDWQAKNEQCIANAQDMISRYGTAVIICEVGMPWNEADAAKAFLSDLIARAKAVPDGKCQGVFYWEPQAYGNWKGYPLGAFDNSGKPTAAMDAFKE